MKARAIYIIAVFCLLIFPAAATIITGSETVPADEDAGPLLMQDFSDLGEWFETHFAGRSGMITAQALLKQATVGSTYGDRVLIGRDGYLFYADTLNDYFRRDTMSPRRLFMAAYNLRLMQDYCRAHDAQFLFVLCANKNTLYPQYMPENYQMGEGKTNAALLIPYLDKLGVAYADMYPVLAGVEEAYFRRDTHWTQAGALYGYEAIRDALGLPPIRSEESVWNTQKHSGDLERMLLPDAWSVETAPVRYIPWHYSASAESYEDNIQTENPEGSGALLMFRDSFGDDLLPYLAETFQTCWFTKTWPCIMNDVETIGATDVILERVERSLPDLTVRPLLMASPEVQIPDAVRKQTDTCVELIGEGGWVRICACVPEEFVKEETRMFIGVESGGNRHIYTAVLCVTEEDTEGGCYIYIDRSQLGDAVSLEVFVQDAQDTALVFQGSTAVPPAWGT